ncbi:MAG: hypothetical protein KatS3mg003_2093 [Candidatus Nitrosocaldaceae archaeon]|nr:MAG: hypothetical protein KatS3mg003_2093 [Candidatus Nitrosocaldaceae archaeon]
MVINIFYVASDLSVIRHTTYYDILGNPPLKYHEIHVRQLAELYNITKDKLFKEYYYKWKDGKEPVAFKAKRRMKWIIRRLKLLYI